MINLIETTPEAVERLAEVHDTVGNAPERYIMGHPHHWKTAATLRALSARIEELEADQFEKLAKAHADWSQATFGGDQDRDHTGPLAHLKKEIAEIEQAPHDGSEWADGLLLLLDGSRRAGFPASKLLSEAKAKLKINMERTWSKPNADGSVEHVRAKGGQKCT